MLNLADGGTTFAFRAAAFEDLTIEEESRYLTWTAYNSFSVYNPETNQSEDRESYLEMAEGDETNFALTDSQKDFFNKNKGFRCFKDNNIEIKGNYLSDDISTLVVIVNYCNQTIDSNGFDLADIKTAIERSWVDILIASQYIDFNDIEEPLKYQYDASYYIALDELFSTDFEMYISKSEYTFYDNVFWSDTVSSTGDFYQVDYTTQSNHKIISDEFELFFFEMRISNKLTEYERRVYSLYALVGNIGGFYGLANLAGAFIVGFISSRVYMHHLANNLHGKLNFETIFGKFKPQNVQKEGAEIEDPPNSPKFEREISKEEEKTCKTILGSKNINDQEVNNIESFVLEDPVVKNNEVHNEENLVIVDNYKKNKYSSKFLCWDILNFVKFKRVFTSGCKNSKMAYQIEQYK